METTGKVMKANQFPKNHVVELDTGEKLSAFGNLPSDLVVGNTYTFGYTMNGKYMNYTRYVLSESDHVKVSVESVQDKKEDTQQSITVGQSCNLALQHLHTMNQTFTEEEFNAEFVKQSKRFYSLLSIVRENILGK